MSEVNFLLSNYSVEELIVIVVIALLLCKVLLELGKFFYEKAKNYFGVQNKKEQWESTTTETLNQISNKVDAIEISADERKERLINVEKEITILHDYSKHTHEEQKEMGKQMKLVEERLQENTRSFLIDAHHRFCYEVKGIDDLNLQSLERRYMYYKAAGGDSFVDDMMDEIRGLPRINYLTVKDQPVKNWSGGGIHG